MSFGNGNWSRSLMNFIETMRISVVSGDLNGLANNRNKQSIHEEYISDVSSHLSLLINVSD